MQCFEKFLTKRVIVTIGPSSISDNIVKRLSDLGVSDFRINLSHCNTDDLIMKYEDVLSNNCLLRSLDTQGAQIRIHDLSHNKLGADETCILCISTPPANSIPWIKINHQEIFDQIEIQDIIKIGFEGVIAEVVDIQVPECLATLRIIYGGEIERNKAIDINNKSLRLNSFTKFDKTILQTLQYTHTKSVFISFCSEASSITKIRRINQKYGKNVDLEIMAKIENKAGINNLSSIVKESDGIVIDRGDLSREIGIARTPNEVNKIVAECKRNARPCYVATDIFDSMIEGSHLPTRAEISDLYNLLDRGIDGIVLAAEVAIGKHPVECVKIFNHIALVHEYEKNKSSFKIDPTLSNPFSLPLSIYNWL